MIEKMTKYSFILLSREREEFLSQIQELGVLDITRSAKPVDDHSVALLRKVDEARATIATLQKGEDAHLSALKGQLRELEKAFEEALAEIPVKMSLLGHNDYEEYCEQLISAIDKA